MLPIGVRFPVDIFFTDRKKNIVKTINFPLRSDSKNLNKKNSTKIYNIPNIFTRYATLYFKIAIN